MNKFKVGDRVVFYDQGVRRVGYVNIVTPFCKRDQIYYVVALGSGKRFPVSGKQCRRLVKKPRRRVWLLSGVMGNFYFNSLDEAAKIRDMHEAPGVKVHEFVEVKKK